MESFLLRFLAVFCMVLCCDGLPVEANEDILQPLTHMTTCQIVEYNGYVCEKHFATTKDGYILELHRIPHGRNSNASTKGVAFLQHGLIDSSFTWIANSPNQSLGYILAERGYDVWLGNSRGNTYSRTHVRLTTEDKAYWDFSFDEMAKFDNPAALDYILKLTGEKQVNYIGHSQGTMIGFAGFSTIPSLARKIKLFIALAPVTHIYHIKGLLKVLSSGTWIAKKIIGLLGVKNFAPNGWVVKTVSGILCKGMTTELCKALIFLITGFDDENLITNRLILYTTHTPAGTSVKDVIHFSQLVQQDKFQMYDYGWNGNMHKYLQPYPPQYEMNDMKVPVALFVGLNDWLATPQDITINLRGKLPNLIYDQDIDDWNHMDFVWGAHANTKLYENVITLMEGKQPYSNKKPKK